MAKFWNFKYILILIAMLNCYGAQGFFNYKDYKIYDVYANDQQDLNNLRKLSKEAGNYDFLYVARSLKETTKVMIAPQEDEYWRQKLKNLNIQNYTMAVSDLSTVVVKERQDVEKRATSQRSYPLNVFENFYRHAEINEHMETLARLYPSRVFVKQFGLSYERRPLKIITITNGDGRSDKKVIFIDAAMHAREWITPSMALHIMHELTANYEEHKNLLQDYDWVIMPMVNVDGYEFTHDEYRYWRKTRSPNNARVDNCIGTDPNRNFGYHWGSDEGASSDPCQEVYFGKTAFSEPETQVVRDIMLHYSDRLIWYLSMHSYGNYILLPWGHTSELPDNFFDIMEIADAGAIAIVVATGSSYTYGSAYSVMYETSGDSTDYAVGVIKVPIAMAMELPAGGFSGFDPPVRQIEDIVSETWIGIRAMAEEVVKKY